jgi:hypothetical protein
MPPKQVTFKGSTLDITISGDSAKEIADEYARFNKELEEALGLKRGEASAHAPNTVSRKAVRPATQGSLSDDIIELVSEGFFDKSKTLAEAKDALAAKGVIKPITTLSGVMQDLVKKRSLSREHQTMGKKEVWVYRKLS